MKFVCIECDEPMKFAKNDGLDDDGSLSVNFICPSCEWGVTLLTNPQETQMVRSLGVKIGGSTVPPKPMEMLQTHLAGQRAAQGVAEQEPAGGSACPFSALVQDVYQEAEAPAAPRSGPGAGLQWSAEATERLQRVPEFIRPMARKGIETYAREQGVAEITPNVMEAAREHMGM